MKRTTKNRRARAALPALAVTTLVLLLAGPGPALAHCDTLDGPVVVDARKALDSGDLTPVLKWVKTDAEPEIRAAFARSLAVRESGPAARDLADAWFFETLVRVHRAGEGAPYTGLKPAGSDVEPGIEAADRALESGSVDPLLEDLTAAIEASVRERFGHAVEAAREKETSVQAGREYVEAYVQFIHSIERLHQETARKAPEEHHSEEHQH
jgi:hypothetical protein